MTIQITADSYQCFGWKCFICCKSIATNKLMKEIFSQSVTGNAYSSSSLDLCTMNKGSKLKAGRRGY